MIFSLATAIPLSILITILLSLNLKPDDEVIITIIADEAIQAPTVSTNHGSASTVSNVDGGLNRKWEARHTAGEFENLGDTSTLADPSVVNDLIEHRKNK